MNSKPLRILGGAVGAVIGYLLVRAALGGGVSVHDLRKFTVAGITAEFPGNPERFEVPIPPEIRTKVVSMENYQTVKKDFMAAASKVIYTPDIEANIDGAVTGSISNIMSGQQLTKVSEQRRPVTVSGLAGLRFSAVFNKSGEEFEMNGVILGKGPTLWNVFAFSRKSDPAAHDAAVRIVGSVEIAP
jgi:hypothetical protein